jgi:hypothetical protein
MASTSIRHLRLDGVREASGERDLLARKASGVYAERRAALKNLMRDEHTRGHAGGIDDNRG